MRELQGILSVVLLGIILQVLRKRGTAAMRDNCREHVPRVRSLNTCSPQELLRESSRDTSETIPRAGTSVTTRVPTQDCTQRQLYLDLKYLGTVPPEALRPCGHTTLLSSSKRASNGMHLGAAESMGCENVKPPTGFESYRAHLLHSHRDPRWVHC